MYEKILVPLDGSLLAEVALPHAEELAGRLGSEIILLSVTESAEAEDYHKHQIYIETKIGETIKQIGKYIENQGERIISVKSVILVGHPAEEIVRYATQGNIGLIVMATHGSSGMKRWTLGRMADKILRATERPVALIRAAVANLSTTKKALLQKALVALDGSEESEAVIPYIEELASKLQTEVTLLQVVAPAYHVMADAEAYLENIRSLFQSKGINTKSVVRTGAAAGEIIKVADETGADIVAMSTHGRSGIGRWSIGSVADKVLRGGNTPILLVRTPGANTG